MFNIQWNQFWILWAMGMIGVIAVLPYSLSLSQGKLKEAPLPLPLLLMVSIGQNAILMAIAVWLGLLAASQVGLGAPLLGAALAGGDVGPLLLKQLPIVVSLGLVSGVSLLGIEKVFFAPRLPRELTQADSKPGPWKGFLASFYGGITEEIFMRLFLMSGLAWLLGLVWQAPGGMPAQGVYWAAIFLASLIFGAGHLPVTAQLTRLTPLVVTRAMVLNGIGGVAFGLLYWKLGLAAAMMAHFILDILIHVIAPFYFKPVPSTNDMGNQYGQCIKS